ncbi:hypothetical protein BGZ63DRAFT_249253 [Mariannaea sp. PMI_226]|nr:hypothetical protein BGZ63DRAFT_249253 [Mariannaea sp. PMI_226]
MPSATETRVDALVVGAGFGGIYATYSFKKRGYNVLCIERAPTAGGVWYWNRYPGAMSDTESYLYRYSWDKDDLKNYPWPNRYLYQPEILKYLNHVVDKQDLRKSMQFNTEMQSATWDEEKKIWRVVCATGDVFIAKYFVTAMGGLSELNLPNIKGLDTFCGRLIHTQQWPEDLDLKGKTVGVVGNGSTGVQLMTAIAPIVKRLVSFQRSPQYSVPSGQQPATEDYRKAINDTYHQIYEQVWNSGAGFGVDEAKTPLSSVSAEERTRTFERLWEGGNAFRFYFGGFGDISTDEEANRATCAFIHSKIDQIVKDPKKAKMLKPTDLYNRRPLCDSGYYQIFNRDNVELVSLRETPISSVVPEGIKTSDGHVHEVDILIFATGFDAIEGSYARTDIKGRNGKRMSEHWRNGPASYAGAFMPDFPNMFMVFGPQGPFSNGPLVVEVEVNFIMQCVERAETLAKSKGDKTPVVEVKPEAEEQWKDICDKEADGSLFKTANSWIFGTNIPGRKPAVTFYFPGLKGYLDNAKKEVESGFSSFIWD